MSTWSYPCQQFCMRQRYFVLAFVGEKWSLLLRSFRRSNPTYSLDTELRVPWSYNLLLFSVFLPLELSLEISSPSASMKGWGYSASTEVAVVQLQDKKIANCAEEMASKLFFGEHKFVVPRCVIQLPVPLETFREHTETYNARWLRLVLQCD